MLNAATFSGGSGKSFNAACFHGFQDLLEVERRKEPRIFAIELPRLRGADAPVAQPTRLSRLSSRPYRCFDVTEMNHPGVNPLQALVVELESDRIVLIAGLQGKLDRLPALTAVSTRI